jgi:hypothetical protein
MIEKRQKTAKTNILWRVKKRKWKWKTRKSSIQAKKMYERCAESRMNANGVFAFIFGEKFLDLQTRFQFRQFRNYQFKNWLWTALIKLPTFDLPWQEEKYLIIRLNA